MPAQAAAVRGAAVDGKAVAPARAELTKADSETLLIRLSGDWTLTGAVPDSSRLSEVIKQASPAKRLGFDSTALGSWDSRLLVSLLQLREAAAARNLEFDTRGLPEGIDKIIALALAVAPKQDTGETKARAPLLARIGNRAMNMVKSAREPVTFLGEISLSLGHLFAGRARFQFSDLRLFIQEAGAEALPIVTLISFLTGLTFAFVGSVQLRVFGVQIYVANLVTLAMAREMGAMMTAIIMAGRTGAAYAAQIGTMQVNEEVNALKTFGIPAVDFLVLPRMLALMLMTPLLCAYSIFAGMLGGFIIGVLVLGIEPAAYVQQSLKFIHLYDFGIGIIKASVFGAIVAFCGCLRGMQSRGSAAAVGQATTSAVVTSLVWIVVVDGLFAVVTSSFGI